MGYTYCLSLNPNEKLFGNIFRTQHIISQKRLVSNWWSYRNQSNSILNASEKVDKWMAKIFLEYYINSISIKYLLISFYSQVSDIILFEVFVMEFHIIVLTIFAITIGVTTACFITNCPPGGKRSLPMSESAKKQVFIVKRLLILKILKLII